MSTQPSSSKSKRRTPNKGDHIEVYWPDDQTWYGGTLGLYFRPTRRFAVNYNDGDREVLDLSKEKWRFKGDTLPVSSPSVSCPRPSTPPHVQQPPAETTASSSVSPASRKSPSRAQKKRAPTKNRTPVGSPPSSSLAKSKRDAEAEDDAADIDDAGVREREQPNQEAANNTSEQPMEIVPPAPVHVPLPWEQQSLSQVANNVGDVTANTSPAKSGYVSEETLSAGGPSPENSAPRSQVPLKLKLGVTKKRVRGSTPSPTEVSVAEALASLEVEMNRADEIMPKLASYGERKLVAKEQSVARIEKMLEKGSQQAQQSYKQMSSVLDAVKVRTLLPHGDLLSVLRDARSQIIKAFERPQLGQ